MVNLFGTKSIESLQLHFRIEDAVYIVLLCKSWTKRSMWEHQAWCWDKDTRELFAGCLWPRRQSQLPEFLCLPSTACNSTIRATEGTGTSNRVCHEALEIGKCMSSVGFSWRRAEALWAVMAVLPALAEVGPASVQSSSHTCEASYGHTLCNVRQHAT